MVVGQMGLEMGVECVVSAHGSRIHATDRYNITWCMVSVDMHVSGCMVSVAVALVDVHSLGRLG